MEELIYLLQQKKLTISTMESCTGGGVANEITNIKGASDVFSFGAVTYSNDFKVKMGVDSEVIDEYTVYSMETAHEMAKTIAIFSGSDFGIGITGKLNRIDPNNLVGEDNTAFISIYDKNKNRYIDRKLKVTYSTRRENKQQIIENIVELFLENI